MNHTNQTGIRKRSVMPIEKTNLKAYEFQKREHKENSHYVKIEGTIYYVHDVFDAHAKETAEDKLRYLMEQEMQKVS